MTRNIKSQELTYWYQKDDVIYLYFVIQNGLEQLVNFSNWLNIVSEITDGSMSVHYETSERRELYEVEKYVSRSNTIVLYLIEVYWE